MLFEPSQHLVVVTKTSIECDEGYKELLKAMAEVNPPYEVPLPNRRDLQLNHVIPLPSYVNLSRGGGTREIKRALASAHFQFSPLSLFINHRVGLPGFKNRRAPTCIVS